MAADNNKTLTVSGNIVTTPLRVQGGIKTDPVRVGGGVSFTGADPYEGAYEITPTNETQVLETTHKKLAHNIIINPIPSNYGLITWNGSILTVS